MVRALIRRRSCAERLAKTGGTPYAARGASRDRPGLMLPASAINAMRRDVLAS